VSGSNRVEIRKTKALAKFVKDAPDISMDILAALKDVWFPDDEMEDMNKAIAENMLGWMEDRGDCGMEDKMEEYVKAKYPDLAEKFPHLFGDEYAEFEEVKEEELKHAAH
jgi:hypothetical protein